MSEQPQLHSSIVAMVSLASGIASNHPNMGQCQLERLRKADVPQHQLDAAIAIARHIRDEAAQKLDTAFAGAAAAPAKPKVEKGKPLDIKVTESACCMPTASPAASIYT
jgi:hypothetical protein